jgi:hypothetical protein
MAALHNKCLPIVLLITIYTIVDAHDGSSQFHRIDCSPLEVFDLHTLKGLGFPMALFFCPAVGARPKTPHLQPDLDADASGAKYASKRDRDGRAIGSLMETRP